MCVWLFLFNITFRFLFVKLDQILFAILKKIGFPTSFGFNYVSGVFCRAFPLQIWEPILAESCSSGCRFLWVSSWHRKDREDEGSCVYVCGCE